MNAYYTSPPKTVKLISAVVVVLLLAVAMPSGESFWIDEMIDASFTRHETFANWWTALKTYSLSQAQMPLSMLVSYGWGRLIGTDEWALRSINIFWVVLMSFFLWRAGRALGCPWAGMLVVVHPFIWFYANEARPYCFQMALSSGFAWALVSWWRAMCRCQSAASAGLGFRGAFLVLFSFLLGASNILAYVLLLSVAVVVVVMMGWAECRVEPWVKLLKPGLVGLLVHLPPVVYHVGTLLRGAGGKKMILAQVGILNLGFVLYEVLGFQGWGPGRDVLRERFAEAGIMGVFNMAGQYWLPLLLLAGCWCALIISSVKEWKYLDCERKWDFALIGSPIILSSLILYNAAYVRGVPFWGRHLASSFPFFLLMLALCMKSAARQTWGRWSAYLLVGLLLSSSMVLRFSDRHAKDDYRTAVAYAQEGIAEGKTVWWVASEAGANFYGLSLCRDGMPGMAVNAANLPSHRARYLTAPDILLILKPSLHDINQVIKRKFASDRGYEVEREWSSFRLLKRDDRFAD